MDLDTGLSTLLSWNFLLFAIGIAIIVFIIRTIVENVWKNIANNVIYRDVLLPIVPPILGAIIGFFATNYAYPNDMSSTSDRLIFGAVCGAFSGLVYRAVKGAITQKISQETNPTTQFNVFPNNPCPNPPSQTAPVFPSPVAPLPPPPSPPSVAPAPAPVPAGEEKKPQIS